jgi:hypothetical protein
MTSIMTKTRLFILGALAALALSAATAASASAEPFWSVNGTPVTTPVDGTFTSGTSKLKSVISGTKVAVISTLDTGQFLLEEKGKTKYTVTFTGLSINEVLANGEEKALTACVVEIPPFSGTDQLKETVGTNLPDEFKGLTETFTTIIIKTCALKGSYEVKGTVNGILSNGTENLKLQDVLFTPGVEQNLKLGKETAEFASKESLILNSLLPFSALNP